jgi:hypothetical protein
MQEKRVTDPNAERGKNGAKPIERFRILRQLTPFRSVDERAVRKTTRSQTGKDGRIPRKSEGRRLGRRGG